MKSSHRAKSAQVSRIINRSPRTLVGMIEQVPASEIDQELREQMKDLQNPTRYVIALSFGRKSRLFYVPADGNFVLNRILEGALFKRKAEASAVAKLLSGKLRPPQILTVVKTKTGIQLSRDGESRPHRSTKAGKKLTDA
jgi:hypothetical protein